MEMKYLYGFDLIIMQITYVCNNATLQIHLSFQSNMYPIQQPAKKKKKGFTSTINIVRF